MKFFPKNIFKHTTESGAAMIEFAFAAPIFIFVIFGVLDFCLIYTRRNHLQQAVTGTAAMVAKEPGSCAAQKNFATATLTQYLTLVNSIEYAKTLEIGSSAISGSGQVKALDFIVEAMLPCWTCPILFQGSFELPIVLSATPILEVDRNCSKVKIDL